MVGRSSEENHQVIYGWFPLTIGHDCNGPLVESDAPNLVQAARFGFTLVRERSGKRDAPVLGLTSCDTNSDTQSSAPCIGSWNARCVNLVGA